MLVASAASPVVCLPTVSLLDPAQRPPRIEHASGALTWQRKDGVALWLPMGGGECELSLPVETSFAARRFLSVVLWQTPGNTGPTLGLALRQTDGRRFRGLPRPLAHEGWGRYTFPLSEFLAADGTVWEWRYRPAELRLLFEQPAGQLLLLREVTARAVEPPEEPPNLPDPAVPQADGGQTECLEAALFGGRLGQAAELLKVDSLSAANARLLPVAVRASLLGGAPEQARRLWTAGANGEGHLDRSADLVTAGLDLLPVLFNAGDLSAAEACAERCVELAATDDQRARGTEALGHLRVGQGRLRDGLELLARSTQLWGEPEHRALAQRQLALTLLPIHKPGLANLAAATFETAGLLGESSYLWGWHHKQQGDGEQAAKCFCRAADEYPGSTFAADALVELGDLRAAQGKYAEAQECYVRVKQAHPQRVDQCARAQLHLSYLYGKQEQYERGIAEAQKVVADFPTVHSVTAAAFLEIGYYYRQLRQYAPAAQAFEQVLRLPHDQLDFLIKARFYLGEAYYNTDQLAKAVEHYRECVALVGSLGRQSAGPGQAMHDAVPPNPQSESSPLQSSSPLAPYALRAQLGIGRCCALLGRGDEARLVLRELPALSFRW